MEISASIGFLLRQKSVSSRPRNCPHCGQKYPPWRTESARAFSCYNFDQGKTSQEYPLDMPRLIQPFLVSAPGTAVIYFPRRQRFPSFIPVALVR